MFPSSQNPTDCGLIVVGCPLYSGTTVDIFSILSTLDYAYHGVLLDQVTT